VVTALDPRRLIFVIGPPRGGTTLLMRMLNAHPDVDGRPEPHLLTPLAYLGYFGRVDKAPYDPFQSHLAAVGLVESLPGGEADYVEALRGYTDAIYASLLQASGKRVLVDKTPEYSLILPFLLRLYPDATYVVLTRHPFAVWCSYARSFFDDDWDVALAHNPILARYIPAVADFLRADVEHRIHVRYEDLVTAPEAELARICEVAGLTPDPRMVEYGRVPVSGQGPGDPVTVDREGRPTTDPIDAWAAEVADRPDRQAFLDDLVRLVPDADLEAWGSPRATLWDPLEGTSARGPRRRRWDRHHLERAVLVALRKGARTTSLGPLLRRLRFALDVVLRD
jgi:hypothetical protein